MKHPLDQQLPPVNLDDLCPITRVSDPIENHCQILVPHNSNNCGSTISDSAELRSLECTTLLPLGLCNFSIFFKMLKGFYTAFVRRK